MTVIGGLLLAAGGGQRFGEPKALLRFEGRLLVERGVDLLATAGCRPLVVVLGAAAEQVRAGCHLDGAEVVVNDDWATGIGSSLRVGLRALAGTSAQCCVIALADQPLITPAAVARVAAAGVNGSTAAVATYRGRPDHPVLLHRSVWAEVAVTAAADAGARHWLRAHAHLVAAVPCGDIASAADIDRPDDLARLDAART